MYSSTYGFDDMASLFLDRHAVVDAVSKEGLTPLMYAALNNRLAVVKLLIAKGADVNFRLHDDDTILMMLADRGNTELAQLLIEHGAMVNARNKYSNTALMNACRNSQAGMVKLLLAKGADITIKDSNGDAALAHAGPPGRQHYCKFAESGRRAVIVGMWKCGKYAHSANEGMRKKCRRKFSFSLLTLRDSYPKTGEIRGPGKDKQYFFHSRPRQMPDKAI